MIIHVVQRGDTLAAIAEEYNIPLRRLEIDNNLPPNSIPNLGQAIMIAPPEKSYTVREGDTLSGIARANDISVLQLLRNNPDISDTNNIYVGEELVISYDSNKRINVMGYTSIFIQEQILRKTLPFLTYLTILNYRADPLGNIQSINDMEIIRIALEYNVAPIMFVSAMSDSGRGSYAVTHSILNNLDIQNRFIHNILEILKARGYVGINLAFTQILTEDLRAYGEFVSNVTERLNEEGYVVFVSLSPNTLKFQAGVKYAYPFFAEIGRAANYVILITYLWQEGSMDLVRQTNVNFLKEYLDYVVSQIPPEKIMIGLTRIAYDWELPYIENETIGVSLANSGAINLANQLGSVIEFDDVTQTPYFRYNSSGAEHFVWFKDARSINAILDLVDEYGLYGVAVWNIMYYYSQTWLSINSKYRVDAYEPISVSQIDK